MSLVTVVCGIGSSAAVAKLAAGMGYVVRSAASSEPIDLAATPDLLLTVENRTGVERIVELDQDGVRYWLLFAGSIPGTWERSVPRRPHAWVPTLNVETEPYLHRLLDDWMERPVPRVDCFHFSYRDGVPSGADWVVDTRCLDSPHWVAELRAQGGDDVEVARYVTEQPAARLLLDHFESLIKNLIPHYVSQRRTVLRIAVGCTGGQHRSQAISEALVARINRSGVATARRLSQPPLSLNHDQAYVRPPGAVPPVEVEGRVVRNQDRVVQAHRGHLVGRLARAPRTDGLRGGFGGSGPEAD